jgi:hypothetical protein
MFVSPIRFRITLFANKKTAHHLSRFLLHSHSRVGGSPSRRTSPEGGNLFVF